MNKRKIPSCNYVTYVGCKTTENCIEWRTDHCVQYTFKIFNSNPCKRTCIKLNMSEWKRLFQTRFVEVFLHDLITGIIRREFSLKTVESCITKDPLNLPLFLLSSSSYYKGPFIIRNFEITRLFYQHWWACTIPFAKFW